MTNKPLHHRHDQVDGQLYDLVESALARARSQGASAAEAAASSETGLSATVRLGEVETLEHHRDRGIVVTVYRGARKGSASSADLSQDSVLEAVDKACSIARFTAEDDCAGLAPAERMATEALDLDLHHPWDLTTSAAIDLALACEQAARDYDPRIHNSEGATVNSHRRQQVYGNSHGLLAGYPATSHSISCSVLAQDAAGMERDYWYTTARAAEELDTPASVGECAARRAVRRLGSRQCATTRLPVLFPPYLARGLISHYLGAVAGGSQYRKSTFLLDALGETVFPDFVSISERPHLPRGAGSTGFDSEGVATRDRDLVRDGIVSDYILSSYSARKLGRETTANAGGVHNILVSSSSDCDQAALMAQMGNGFLLTELIGQGINPVTGDYSRGAAGLMIENGQVAGPVNEITIAGNLRDMFAGVVAVGNDADVHSKIRCGSILINEMTLAGN